MAANATKPIHLLNILDMTVQVLGCLGGGVYEMAHLQGLGGHCWRQVVSVGVGSRPSGVRGRTERMYG